MVIIGGSGSTGSSLLQSILNRHTDIVAGQETSIFMYPHLYEHWKRYRGFLVSKGMFGVKSRGWTYRNGMDLLHEDYGWKRPDILSILNNTNDFLAFVQIYFEKSLSKKGARHWIEKTPQNVYAFDIFLKTFAEGKVIQMLRDPYDTMASLMARGFDAYQAAGYFIYNTACGASVEESERSLKIHYEDLVLNPTNTIELVMNFINLPFDSSMLNPSKEEITNPLKLKGWNHSEREHVKKSSIGRFAQLSNLEQSEIIAALNTFVISKHHLDQYEIRFSNFMELCSHFNYEYRETDSTHFINAFKSSRMKDMLKRTGRLHPGHVFNYPGELRDC